MKQGIEQQKYNMKLLTFFSSVCSPTNICCREETRPCNQSPLHKSMLTLSRALRSLVLVSRRGSRNMCRSPSWSLFCEQAGLLHGLAQQLMTCAGIVPEPAVRGCSAGCNVRAGCGSSARAESETVALLQELLAKVDYWSARSFMLQKKEESF